MQKKKFSELAVLLCASVLLCSCSDPGNSAQIVTSETADTTEATSTVDTQGSESVGEPQTEEIAETADREIETVEKTDGVGLPRTDGSTSAAPLEIGLKSGFLGIPYDQAKELVSHTTTHDSFKRLINGEVDLIFSVPISEEQQKMADEAGVTLFMEPVAREGFVFVVNEDNPVDSLTSEQLRKIYSGEITNWSQVGGNDEPILPYQRNTDSGSQNYMTVFMGDTPLLPPKPELVQGMMMSLMDAIAVYDNSAGAIGYSVYSYAAQMYANANKVKFIAVDGVKPSKAAMADESYPLLSCTYIIYTDKSPESAREFAEKVLSDEGQRYVLESGYLPVNGMEIPDKYLPYEAVGTGEPKPADFEPSLNYSCLFRWNYDCRKINGYFELDFLKDEELQARINGDIRAAMDELRKHYKPEYAGESDYAIDGISLNISCRNGYLSLVLGYFDDSAMANGNMEWIMAYHNAETLTYDLIEGKKIERFSDLFYEGVNFLPDVNQSIVNWISQAIFNINPDYVNTTMVQKQDFSCILGDPRLFTLDLIGLEPDNPYFTCAPFLSYSDDNWHSMANQYRDMSGIINDKYLDRLHDYEYDEWKFSYITEDGDTYKRITGSAYHTDEEVKAEDEFWYSLQKRAWETFRKANPNWRSGDEVYPTDIGTYELNNFYQIGLLSLYAGEYPRANFDADTLELITMEMLIGDDWRQYLSDTADPELNYIPSEWWGDSKFITVLAYPDSPIETEWEQYVCTVSLSVSREAMNERYFTPQ